MSAYTVAALYLFTPLSDLERWQAHLYAVLEPAGVRGTILLAAEGVNGTIAGPADGIDAAMSALRALPGCAGLEAKYSTADEMPFLRLKVRLKREIVTLGVPGVDPNRAVGTYVPAAEWNQVVDDPQIPVIDTRNNYEVAIGSFAGATDPQTTSFRDFPKWFEEYKATHGEVERVAMFCTGGIRCEKASSYLLSQGVKEVLHLQGGILKYLEEVPAEESRWQGECFVFDGRVSVGHGLVQGSYDLCHACRMPITDEDKQHTAYSPGVSCPKCIDTVSPERRRAFAERERQMRLAAERGETHLGSAPSAS